MKIPPETLTDLTRERIGRLRVIAYKGKKSKKVTESGKRIRNNARHLWLCQCECGRTVVAKHNRLLQGIKRCKPLSCRQCEIDRSIDPECQKLSRRHRLVIEGRTR